MTALRALLTYEDVLRSLQKQMASAPIDLPEMLEAGLGYLASRFRLGHVSFFMWNPHNETFTMKFALYSGTLMEGDEEIHVDSQSGLDPLIKEGRPLVISKKPWVAYVPLHAGDRLIGALRLERARSLPKGKVLASLTPYSNKRDNQRRELPLLEEIADIFSAKLAQLEREERNLTKARYLQANSEVATAIFERPRLRDMLECVSKSIVQNLGFDRVRFYLVGPGKKELKGVVGFQMPGRPLDLDRESYPFELGVNTLVDAVLSQPNNGGVHVRAIDRHILYVPMVANRQVIGCLAADNLLSQQIIDNEQREALKTLAGVIGMAVVNARLFEDIEQQAITDGLTKLYVFRYFQQRLREEIDRADRYSYGISLVMMDVDNFKNLNDAYGHLLGDKVLEFLAHTLRSNIRRIDLAARYGGDEFVLVLPEITQQEAWLMGARLLNALKQCSLKTPSGEPIPIAVTMGAAMYPADAKNARDLIEAADRALYWAKKNNRGDICFFKKTELTAS